MVSCVISIDLKRSFAFRFQRFDSLLFCFFDPAKYCRPAFAYEFGNDFDLHLMFRNPFHCPFFLGECGFLIEELSSPAFVCFPITVLISFEYGELFVAWRFHVSYHLHENASPLSFFSV
jgi:hypothetical protein